MKKADLSIIITCFNKEEYIDEAINSVLEQTVASREIILVHDACENPAHHIKVTSIMLKENVGVAKARMEGVRFSKGEYLLFLDGDDKLAPDYIEQMFIKRNKGDIIYPNILWWYSGCQQNRFEKIGKITPKQQLKVNKILVTSLMKKEVFYKVGGFRDLPIYEDWDFWLRAMSMGYKFAPANTMLYYRQNPKTRNRQTDDLKQKTYYQIKKQFELKRGKLCLATNTQK